MKKLWSLYKKHQEIIDYLFWGGVAFVLSMGLFWAFTSNLLPLQWNEIRANNVDWVICVIFTFFTNKWFVFRSKSGSVKGFCKEFVSFVLARLFTLFLEDFVIWLLCSVCGWESGLMQLMAKFIGQFVVIVTNYILSKLIIFRKPKNKVNEE